jgi:hypothetical protein
MKPNLAIISLCFAVGLICAAQTSSRRATTSS